MGTTSPPDVTLDLYDPLNPVVVLRLSRGAAQRLVKGQSLGDDYIQALRDVDERLKDALTARARVLRGQAFRLRAEAEDITRGIT